jgi:hypothetical protein
VLYSFFKAECGHNARFDSGWVEDMAGKLKKHRKYYLNNSLFQVSYEELLNAKLNGLWKSIFEFFKIPFNPIKAEKVIAETTKEKLADRYNSKYMNRDMLTKEYRQDREKFVRDFYYLKENF